MAWIGRGCAATLVVVAGCVSDEPAPPDELHPLEAYEGGAKQ